VPGRRSAETVAREDAERARLDLLPMTVRCAEPGCEDWVYVGTTGECRAAAAEHRASAHPGLAARRTAARSASEKRLKALERQKKEAQRKSLRSPPPRQSRPETSRDDAILALRAVAAEKGRAPKSTEWTQERRLPRLSALYRIFGGWGAALEAAGMQPTRRRSR
jgi:hypothetical protein